MPQEKFSRFLPLISVTHYARLHRAPFLLLSRWFSWGNSVMSPLFKSGDKVVTGRNESGYKNAYIEYWRGFAL